MPLKIETLHDMIINCAGFHQWWLYNSNPDKFISNLKLWRNAEENIYSCRFREFPEKEVLQLVEDAYSE